MEWIDLLRRLVLCILFLIMGYDYFFNNKEPDRFKCVIIFILAID